MKLNGFIMPNSLWDLDLNVYERAIITHIVRKTIGWGKTEDGISLSQFVKDLQISKSKIISTIKILESKNLIVVERVKKENNSNSFNRYSLPNNLEEVIETLKNNIEGSVSQTQGVVSDKHKGSVSQTQGVVSDKHIQLTSNTINTKQLTSNKKNIQKKEKFEILKDLILQGLKVNRLLSYKDKINISTCKKDLKELDLSIKDIDLQELANYYVNYILANKNYAVRLNKYLIAYLEGNLSDLSSNGISNYTQANKSANMATLDSIKEFLNTIFTVEQVKNSKAFKISKEKYKDLLTEDDIIDYIRFLEAKKRYINIDAYYKYYEELENKVNEAKAKLGRVA